MHAHDVFELLFDFASNHLADEGKALSDGLR